MASAYDTFSDEELNEAMKFTFDSFSQKGKRMSEVDTVATREKSRISQSQPTEIIAISDAEHPGQQDKTRRKIKKTTRARKIADESKSVASSPAKGKEPIRNITNIVEEDERSAVSANRHVLSSMPLPASHMKIKANIPEKETNRTPVQPRRPSPEKENESEDTLGLTPSVSSQSLHSAQSFMNLPKNTPSRARTPSHFNPTSPVSGAGQQFIDAVNKYVHESMLSQELQRQELINELNTSIDSLREQCDSIKDEVSDIKLAKLTSLTKSQEDFKQQYKEDNEIRDLHRLQVNEELEKKEEELRRLYEEMNNLSTEFTDKIAKMENIQQEFERRFSKFMASKDLREETTRQTFALLLKKFEEVEVFMENQRVDNEGLRNVIRDVEEVLLGRHEQDFNYLNERLDKVAGPDTSKSNTPLFRKRRLSDVEDEKETRANKMRKVFKYGVTVVLAGAAAALAIASN